MTDRHTLILWVLAMMGWVTVALVLLIWPVRAPAVSKFVVREYDFQNCTSVTVYPGGKDARFIVNGKEWKP